nr:Uncharacterised protein [Klebsiella pneumoniae]
MFEGSITDLPNAKAKKSNFSFRKAKAAPGAAFLCLMFRTMSLFINRYTSYIL